jgi:ketosteroid isomerase-like protein
MTENSVTRYEPSANDPRIVAVLEASRRLGVAMTSGDVSALESLMAPDLLVNAPINKVVDRANVLARVRASQIRYEPSDEVNILEFVGVRGDCVVVMGEEVVKPISNAPHAGRIVRRRATSIWRETDGVWRLIIRQATVTSVE